jgi:hypothetical protein
MNKEEFESNGYTIVRNFYDIEQDIHPLWSDIKKIIQFVAKKNDVPYEDTGRWFDGYLSIRNKDPLLGGVVYDAIKQLASFNKIITKHESIKSLKLLRGGGVIGVVNNGCGIRIDDPHDIKYKTNWHQDYSGQLRSPRGITIWSPLVDITQELGPITFARGSHFQGYFPIHKVDKRFPDIKVDADAFTFADEEALMLKYEFDTPLLNVGDAVFIDFLNAHKSGLNIAEHSRWSMQLRYFDFSEPVGIGHGWSGGIRSGVDFAKVHPDMFAGD